MSVWIVWVDLLKVKKKTYLAAKVRQLAAGGRIQCMVLGVVLLFAVVISS